MRKIVIGLSMIVVLLVGAAVAVPFLIPADVYVARVAEAVKQATGRDLKVAGPVSFHLLPAIALTASDVSLSNVPGSVDPAFATIGKLDIGLKLIPLLSKKVEISHLSLSQPVIHLEVDKAGHGNWSFQPETAAPRTPNKAVANAVSAQKQLQQLSLGTVSVSGGTLTWLDARTGRKEAASKLDATLSLPSIADKMTLKASALYKGQTIDLDLSATDVGALIDGTGAGLSVTVGSSLFKLTLDGQARASKPFGFSGNMDLSSPSVRNLAAWAGSPLKMSGTGMGPLGLKGKLAVEGSSVSVSAASLTLDAIKAGGALAVNTAGARPLIKGNLELGPLDLDPYLAPAPAPGRSNAEAAPPAAPATAGTGWSQAAIDASALKAVDASLTLSLASLKFHTIEVGRTALALTLGNGRLAIDFKQLSLYGGGGTGRIALDGSNPGIGMDIALTLGNVAMQPLMAATIGVDKFTGTGNVTLDLTAHGRSQAELMAGLGGKGALHIAKGAVKGIDLVAIEHKPLQGLTESSATAETAFTALSGSFTAVGGTFANQDLLLDSLALNVTGKGTIDMYHRSLSYRIEPNLPGNIQGGKTGIYGTAVPILIDGPWTHLSYRPDVQAVLQQKAQKALGGEVDKLLGGNAAGSSKAGGLLKGLLGR